MTVTTALFGSLSGLFIGVYSNGVRKLPLLRKPWEHLVLMGFMGYLGHQYPGIEDATLARAFNLADEVAHRRPCELHKHGRTFAPTDVVALAIARAASESVVKATTSAKLHLHESASCGHDDFREISAGETMKNRYRHAW